MSGCIGGQPENNQNEDEPTQADVVVNMESSEFKPSKINIEEEKTIQFINKDMNSHTVHITDQNGKDIYPDTQVSADESITVTIEQAGTYNLNCELHPGMDGTITVGETTETNTNQEDDNDSSPNGY